MSKVTAKEMLLEATAGGYAVGAFNVTNLIEMEAVVEAAVDAKAPLIIQTSVTPSKFLGRHVLVAIYRTLAESAPIPIALHLDHCKDVEYCNQCADAGYTNVMIDASRQSFEENIRQTKEVCDYCHALGGVSVEGELGTVSGVEDQIKVLADEAALCNPEQAVEFVERTGVDLFAPAIGTAHGVYKTKDPKVDFERLDTINELLNGQGARIPLVVHGGTGLPPDTAKKLVECGGAKFNVSTELKHALIDATYGYSWECLACLICKSRLKKVKDAIRQVVARWIDTLGSANKA